MTNQIDFITAARASAIQWAKDILATPPDQLLILDTETTGLDTTAEIVQLAIIDGAGDVVINTYVKPTRPIPPEATAIHHITDQDVALAPTWETVYPLLEKIVYGKTLVIYNAQYDLRLINQASKAAGIAHPTLPYQASHCAMLTYAEFVGEWNDYRGTFRWQKLQGGDHSALGDVRATLDLIREMAASESEKPTAESATQSTVNLPQSPSQTPVESHKATPAPTFPDIFHEPTTSARGVPVPVTTLLDYLAELRASVTAINTQAQTRINAILTPAQHETIRYIENDRDTDLATTNEAITRLEEEIKAEILNTRTTIKGAHLMAVWNRGRVSWDNKKLEGMMTLIPQLKEARSEGQPSVTIRTI